MSSILVVVFLFKCCLLDSITAAAVLQTPDNFTGLTGNDVTLSCQFVNLLNEQIVWFHKDSNEILTRDSTLATTNAAKRMRYTLTVDDNEWYNLTIRNLSYADEGEYDCGYADNRGDGSANVYLASAFIDVITKPSSPVCNIVYASTIIFPVIGNSVSLECSAPGGDPKPDITWFRGEVVNSNMTEVDTLDLQLTLQEPDRGETFRCEIDIPVLDIKESCQVIPFPIEPIIDIIPDGLVKFGTYVKFNCNAVGDLPLKILSFTTSLASGRFSVNAVGNVMTILNFGQQDLLETISCGVAYNEFDKPFTVTVEIKSILPESPTKGPDPGDHDDSPNKEDTPTLTIVLVVLGIIVVILVITALIWYNRKRIMSNNTDTGVP
ncbi:peroxidasin-like [Anneissia japonica]|uniref:peroxidasin-like n=1 Tax=Anneissia japonica TaxID=1529436 RepID=UPI001425A981|nr:peroxidasin-like [Anneissia japonica]